MTVVARNSTKGRRRSVLPSGRSTTTSTPHAPESPAPPKSTRPISTKPARHWMSFRNRRHVLIACLFATFATARVATVPAAARRTPQFSISTRHRMPSLPVPRSSGRFGASSCGRWRPTTPSMCPQRRQTHDAGIQTEDRHARCGGRAAGLGVPFDTRLRSERARSPTDRSRAISSSFDVPA